MAGNTIDHSHYIRLALDEARKSPPKPTNFRVGALLVDEQSGKVLASGFTLELEGNTHAEQCCLQKFASQHSVNEEDVGNVLRAGTVIYTTMEPCNERLSGSLPCVDRILRSKGNGNKGIEKVYSGVQEPEIFVKANSGRKRLEDAGIQCVHVPGFEDEILQVAKAGHEPSR